MVALNDYTQAGFVHRTVRCNDGLFTIIERLNDACFPFQRVMHRQCLAVAVARFLRLVRR